MANALCVYENMIATVAGTLKFFRELSDYDKRLAVKSIPISRINKTDIAWCDILYMIRPNNPAFARIAKEAHKHGITVVFFLDDDLMNLPKDNADMPWRKKGLALVARNSDIIVSSSPLICKNYGGEYQVSRTITVDTAVPKKDIKKHIDGVNDLIKIVYAAGVAHTTLFDRFVKPILSDLDKRCGDRISLTFMGVHPDLDPKEYRMPIQFIGSMPFDEYRRRVESENFDIGLAPLISSEFTKCKYFNKFIEYAMFGIVGIYSNTEPYTYVIQNKENGILAGDQPEDWLTAICEGVDNKTLIEGCRTHSYETLDERFDSKAIMDGFLRDIPELVKGHKRKEVNGNALLLIKMQYSISRFGDWMYKTLFYFRRGGLKEVIKGIRRRINTTRIEKASKGGHNT